ncbi:MAG TPA: hypothetical protein VND64_12350 [Pirellulales bacterium]|nr:hypothetical protein [Pirellulales bacterium]
MDKPFLFRMRALLGIMALIVILCFAGPLGWPRLDVVTLSLLAIGGCLGVLIVLLPWTKR